ncbi:MAG: putative hypoxanthine-guanine phosphoribosyltransferase [Acidimicrobiales bacterium]|nr:putative hypoxanthine-guanine phosphoribosyltransferase [Acidimicrobiales bacterium]
MVEPERDPPTLLASPADLQAVAARVGAEITADHPDGVVLVGVLKGGVPFLADLSRQVRVPVDIDMVAVAPYDGARGRTRVVKDLDLDVRGRPVVLVTGIVDTGLTSDFLLRHLAEREPSSLALCGLADKRARRLLPVPVTYAGLQPPDRFLLGYGLDFAGRYRNLPGLWAAESSALAEDPDRYLALLYAAVR